MRAVLGAALAALLLPMPATAQDKPAWVGVWDGHVGTYPVRLCVDVWYDGPAHGAYYYLSQLEPISLTDEDGEGGWIEHGPSDQDALWEFTEQTGKRLRGTWRGGSRSLPFDLEPVAWTEGEWGGPCSSAAFLEPRVRKASDLRLEAGERDGLRYVRQIFVPPAHFRDEVTIESFAFEPERPGDPTIVAWLAAHLPSGTTDDDFVECIGGAISAVGADGMFDETLVPVMASRDFLTVEESSGTYCGGAHPNYYTFDHTFDRASGEELDLFDWIGEPRTGGDSTLPEALRDLVVARWPAETGADCRELAAETDYWTLGLARDGLVFRPDLPHAATACEEPVTVEWAALAPFLDTEGKAGLARLRGG